ncbi:Perilipin-2 [Grifola frondosa]|uniref:Perilipin-2 n=1 Tax=Grifola frondosa TaxID=5627 RepID=A0A1C7LSP7_GRIFR|nr:Perilipin-2 [Grifola frondosa]
MPTQTQTASATPEFTIIYRVASIPLVASSLNTIHTTLTNNAYTHSPYAAAKGLSKSALSYAEPLQKRLGPIIVRADSFANKGLDAVESRYPYPFKTPTDEIVKDLKGHSDHAYDVANKTIDERVRTPVYHVAQGIDQASRVVISSPVRTVYMCMLMTSFTEIRAYHRLFRMCRPQAPPERYPEPPAGSPDAKYQYQRAYILSKDLRDQLLTYSTEQINQIKAQSVLVQRASATAESISSLATNSYGAAQVKVQGLSDTMLSELQKIQASTAALPSTLQSSFNDISTHLSSTITDLSAVLTSQDPLPEKVHKVRDTVQERVQPLLDAAAVRVQEILGAVKGRLGEKEGQVQQSVNGSGRA